MDEGAEKVCTMNTARPTPGWIKPLCWERDPISIIGASPMSEYAELLERLQSLIGGDSSDDNIYKQASDAIERLLAWDQGRSKGLAQLEDPSDHEAEGAMRYVMSRQS
jgi:hypothetical protein